MSSLYVTKRKQQGVTLIGMMVGLVISLITIAAMLAVYKASIDISTNASRSAVRDGQISAALLAAQVELQQAGFGLPPGEEGVLLVSEQGRQVLWRYSAYPLPGNRCAGLRLIMDDDDVSIELPPNDVQSDRRGLYWLPDQACASLEPAPTWGSGATERPRLLVSSAGFFVPLDRQGRMLTDEVGSPTLTGLRFEQHEGSDCLPYEQRERLDELSERVQRITLRAQSGNPLFSLCLPNVRTRPTEG